MTRINPERMAAEIDGDFVVFLIGMRINKPWKVWKWLPVARAMPRMLIELAQQPDLGMLHARTHFGFPNIFLVQYWRSFDHLEAYARASDHAHLPAWQAFTKAISGTDDVGIWHETYLIADGAYETVYAGMPPFGLGQAGRLVPATGHKASARERIRKAGTDASASP